MPSTQYKSSVTLFQGVPFTNTYEHTLQAIAKGTKLNWLKDNYVYDTYENLMYIKLSTVTDVGVIRLTVEDYKAQRFNYAYIDDGKGNTYFAFVLGCTYINDGAKSNGQPNSVYEYSIEKDLMMTYVTSAAYLKPCGIDRMHISKSDDRSADVVKHFRIPEPFGASDVLNVDRRELEPKQSNRRDAYYAILQFTPNDGSGLSGYTWNTCTLVPSATDYRMFGMNFEGAYDAIRFFIEERLDSPEQVISLYTVPSFLIGGSGDTGNEGIDITPSNAGPGYMKQTFTVDFNRSSGGLFKGPYNSIDGYTPKNNKVYAYPYCFVRISNDVGEFIDLKLENWSPLSTGYGYSIEGTIQQPVTVKFTPLGYDGTGTSNINPCKKLSITNYPLGNWNNDTLQIYNALNPPELRGIKAVANAVGAGVGGVTKTNPTEGTTSFSAGGMAAGVAGSLVTTAVNDQINKMQAEIAPDTTGGATASSNVEYSNNEKFFTAWLMSIPRSNVEILDKFFTRYGYSFGGKIAKPDPDVREYFSYIKTLDDTFFASNAQNTVNVNEINTINKIFKTGITFWKTTTTTSANIFNFETLDN